MLPTNLDLSSSAKRVEQPPQSQNSSSVIIGTQNLPMEKEQFGWKFGRISRLIIGKGLLNGHTRYGSSVSEILNKSTWPYSLIYKRGKVTSECSK